MAEKQLTDPIKTLMPHYSPVALIQGVKLKDFLKEPKSWSTNVSAWKVFTSAGKRVFKVFILSHPFSPRKGVQTALTQHKWPFKSELLGIHTMTAENLEGTGFLPIWHTGCDKKQDTWEDKRNSHLARTACHLQDGHPLATKVLSATYQSWDSLSLNTFCFKNSASL